MSRSELFQEVDHPVSESETNEIIPRFEFIEVDKTEESKYIQEDASEPANNETGDFEFFPLFATGNLMKVDLTEPVYEEVKIERPKSYYFASYTDSEQQRFEKSAITYEEVIRMAYIPYRRFNEKIIDMNKYNDEIDQIKARELKLKKKKPGKNQRMARKLAKESLMKREEQRQSLKKIFRKRGGKKNKKKKLNPLANAGAVPTNTK